MKKGVHKKCENCLTKDINSLKTLSKDELRKISEAKITKKVNKGDILFEEGERLNGVFCIRKGISKLTKNCENGKSQIIKIIGKGEILGQRSLITDELSDVSAIAVEEMEVCYIPKDNLDISIKNNYAYNKAVLIKMANDLKLANKSIVSMSHLNIKQRIAGMLCFLDNTFGVDDEGYINCILSRQEMAELIGSTKEACIRTLASFKKCKWIITEGKKIKIMESSALENLKNGF